MSVEMGHAHPMEISIRCFDASHSLPLSTNWFFRLNAKQPVSGGGGVGWGGGKVTRPGTEKRRSHNLQSDPLGSGFRKGRENSKL